MSIVFPICGSRPPNLHQQQLPSQEAARPSLSTTATIKSKGDTKGPAKAGDGSGKKDVVAVQPGPSNQVAGNGEKAREIQAVVLEHVELSKSLLEAVIHLESIQSFPKRIDYLDSLVEKFITPYPDNPNMTSITERGVV